jgi:hypothetical protein
VLVITKCKFETSKIDKNTMLLVVSSNWKEATRQQCFCLLDLQGIIYNISIAAHNKNTAKKLFDCFFRVIL